MNDREQDKQTKTHKKTEKKRISDFKKTGLTKDEAQIAQSKAPLIEHFIELRKRIIIVLLGFGTGFLICLFFSTSIFNFLLIPYQKSVQASSGLIGKNEIQLIYTQPLEYFFVKLKLAAFGGFILSFPVFAYQLYRFITPGLYQNEKRVFIPYLIASPVLFICGALLVFLFVFPFILSFALSQQQMGTELAKVVLLPKVSEYLSLAMTLFIAFGISFQLPVFLSLLAHAGLIRSKTLSKGRKYAVILVFTFAAFMTPPDPFSQFILAAAIYTLFELGILAVKLIEKKHQNKDGKEKMDEKINQKTG